MRLQGGGYHQENNLVYAAIHKACAECGLTWINKYKTTKDVRCSLEDLNQYYYGVDSCKEAIEKSGRRSSMHSIIGIILVICMIPTLYC